MITETSSEDIITRNKITQLENQLQKIMSERDEYRDRLLKERNSKVVAYMKPSITDNTKNYPRKPFKKEHKKARHRVKQVSISSDRSEADSAVSSPERTVSLKSYSASNNMNIETNSKYSPLASTCSTCSTCLSSASSDTTSVTRSTSASSISENTTACSSAQTDQSESENLAKTNNILLRAYLANALEKLKISEKEREEIDVELSLEKSKNINLQDQIRSLSELKNKDSNFVSIFDKICTLESNSDGFERFTVSDDEESSCEVVEQVVHEKSVQTCPDHCERILKSESDLKNMENQVIEMNTHLVRLSGQVFAEKMNTLKLTEKIVSLETEITRSVSNIIHTNNQLQCSIYENARFKNSIQNYDLVPKKLVSQHQKGLIQHQQTLFSPMQIVNGCPMLFTGNFHYHYPPLPSFSYGKTATK